MGAKAIAFLSQNKRTAFIAAFVGIFIVIIILAINALKQTEGD